MAPISGSRLIHLTLRYGPLGLVRATAARIGPNSLLVNTGQVSLADNAQVEVLWSERRGHTLESRSIPAKVCGSDQYGARLLFDGPGMGQLWQ